MPPDTPDHQSESLPVVPRRTLAWRLAGRRRLRLIYRVLNRYERGHFDEDFAAQGTDADVVLARRDGRLWLMRVDPEVTADRAAEHNFAFVHSICAAASIPYWAVPEPEVTQPRIAIPDHRWPDFVAAVRRSAARKPVYATLQAVDRRGRPGRWTDLVAAADVGEALLDQRAVRLFEIQAPHAEATFYGRSHGCVVERWSSDPTGAVHAPAGNSRTRVVGASHQHATTMARGGQELATLSVFSKKHVFDLDFPIDLVYLWVDGGDPRWKARKRACQEQLTGEIQPESASDARFRDYGEFRYSLRSVHEYVPWARRIFVVTDQQVPSWLDTDQPGITVVDHTALFGGRGRLPTFNSHAIGSRLHHIEGLSDHYLYVNDDVLFGRPVRPELFFQSNGVSRFFLSKATLPYSDEGAAPPHEDARRNVVAFLEKEFGRTASRTFFHTPVPQRRRIMADLEERYPEIFEANLNSQFRASSDYEINSWLHHYYGYLRALAVPGSIRYDYFDLSDPSVPLRLDRLLGRRDKDCFCINDNAEATPDNQEYIAEWMERYFPRPSPYEKSSTAQVRPTGL